MLKAVFSKFFAARAVEIERKAVSERLRAAKAERTYSRLQDEMAGKRDPLYKS